MNDKKNPCYQCQKRWVKKIDGKTVTCHSSCEEREAWVAEHNEWKSKMIKGRNEYGKTCRDLMSKAKRLKTRQYPRKRK